MLELPRDYKFKTQPYAHQLEAFQLSRDAEYFALTMEMGTGKTKVTIDNAAYLYCNGKIGAVVIVAPNGVHKSWIEDEIPTHMPDYVTYRAHLWRTGKSSTRYDTADRNDLLKTHHLLIASVNIEALTLRRTKDWLKTIMDSRPTFFVLDESTTIKTPNAKRTKVAQNLKKHSAFRRILTGTPVTNSPFDLYSQYNFLHRSIIDMESFIAFKHYYADWKERENHNQMIKGNDGIFRPRLFEEMERNEDGTPAYKNLEELRERIAPYTYRKLKRDCLDLPEKIYTKRYFELSPAARKVYDELHHTFKVELEERDEPIRVPMVLTRMMRLQQVTSGYLPTGQDNEPAYQISGPNERLNALIELVEQSQDKVLVWCRFRPEAELIARELSKLGRTLRYDGSIKQADRDMVEKEFRFGDARYLVATQRSGGRGNNWQAAGLVVYYSNTFSLEDRLQSEDRAHRIGMGDHVQYVDLIAMDTIDEKIVVSLRENKEIADLITGDNAQEWI